VPVLRGGCVPLGEEGRPFGPVVEALRGRPRYRPADAGRCLGVLSRCAEAAYTAGDNTRAVQLLCQAEALMAGDGDRDAATRTLRRSPRSPPTSAPAPRRRGQGPGSARPPPPGLGRQPSGRSNRQIAEVSYISPKTASVHTGSKPPPLATASAWTECAPPRPAKIRQVEGVN
jgi:hypothetical protein